MKKFVLLILLILGFQELSFSEETMELTYQYGNKEYVFYRVAIISIIMRDIDNSEEIDILEYRKEIIMGEAYKIVIDDGMNKKTYFVNNHFNMTCDDGTCYNTDILSDLREVFINFIMSNKDVRDHLGNSPMDRFPYRFR